MLPHSLNFMDLNASEAVVLRCGPALCGSCSRALTTGPRILSLSLPQEVTECEKTVKLQTESNHSAAHDKTFPSVCFFVHSNLAKSCNPAKFL